MRKERFFWGVFFVLAGIALIVSKLGYFEEVNVFSLVAALFLAAILIKSLFKMNFAGILFPAAFIAILFDDQLGITSITPWTVLLAALLGSIGLSIIFGKRHRWWNCSSKKCNFDLNDYDVIDVEDEGNIKVDTSFSGNIKYINTDKLEQVDIRCHFGSSKVYFDNAKLKEGKGVIRLDISFGGVELYIPKTWTVVENTSASFGGIDEKNKNSSTGENVVTLVGSVSFAGVEIIYV